MSTLITSKIEDIVENNPTVIVPCPLSFNELLVLFKSKNHNYATLVKNRWLGSLKNSFLSESLQKPPFPCYIYNLVITCHSKNDVTNLATCNKWLLDAAQEVGYIKDDGQQYIKSPYVLDVYNYWELRNLVRWHRILVCSFLKEPVLADLSNTNYIESLTQKVDPKTSLACLQLELGSHFILKAREAEKRKNKKLLKEKKSKLGGSL